VKELLRKTQLIGRSTFIVSLPKPWAVRVGLKPGTPLRMLLEPDGSLRILPPGVEPRRTESVLNVDSQVSEGSLTRELMSRYLAGYDVIRLRFDGEAHRLRKVVYGVISSKMIGVEVVEDREREIALQVLVNVSELPVNVVIQRMGQVAKGMITDSVEGLMQGMAELLADVRLRDDLLDKLYLYLLRQLNACIRGLVRADDVGLSFIEESIQYAVVGKSIERVGDHAEKISANAQLVLSAGQAPSPELAEKLAGMASLVVETFSNSVQCFASRDRAAALRYMDEYPPKVKTAESELLNVITRDKGYAPLLPLRMVTDSLRRIHDYSMDILEATVDLLIEGEAA